MITFSKDKKEIVIPKGLGNVAVSVQSGATDVVSQDMLATALAKNSRQDRAYASQVADSAATEALSEANAYTDSAKTEAVEEAAEYTDSAITEADYCIFLTGYTQYWNTQVAAINAFIAKMKGLWKGSVISSMPMIQRYRVFIGAGGYGNVVEFRVYDYQGGDSITLTACGRFRGISPWNGISALSITLQKDRQPQEGDLEIKTILYSD